MTVVDLAGTKGRTSACIAQHWLHDDFPNRKGKFKDKNKARAALAKAKELTSAELSCVVKRSNQLPEELDQQELKSMARYVMEKALCMATNTATVKLTADVLCPNCFQHYIAKTLSE